MTDGQIIHEIFAWAWQAGIDVRFYSKSYETPPRWEWNTPHPDTVLRPRGRTDLPVLRFTFNGRHYEIMDRTWASLMKRLEYEHTKIFGELKCPPIGELK